MDGFVGCPDLNPEVMVLGVKLINNRDSEVTAPSKPNQILMGSDDPINFI
jgi:hypothetical protein